MDLGLTGKTAIVTGASRGIGAGIARSLVSEGMNVVVNHLKQDLEAQTLCEKLGVTATVFEADVGEAEEMEAMVKFAEMQFGSLDLMVHNAGITSRTKIIETQPDDWHRVLRTNLDGAYNAARFAAISMIRRKVPGSFVAISSLHGKVAKAEMGAYCASKAAIDMLVRQRFGANH